MTSFTRDQLERLGFRLQPDGSYAQPTTLREHRAAIERLPNTELESAAGATLDGSPQGEGKGPGRIVVRITRRAARPLDADNYAGGCKPLIDQLRYAALIPDDDPESVEIVFRQERVKKKDEGVVVEICSDGLGGSDGSELFDKAC